MKISNLERFLAFTTPNSLTFDQMVLPCWGWTGDVDHKGRPRFQLNGKGMLAKRALYEILGNRKLPSSCMVGSLCHDPQCLRPEHLVLCNKTDAEALGPNGIVDPGYAAVIRDMFNEGYQPDEMAVQIEVSVPLVNAILHEGGLL